MQETFASIWRAARSYRPERGPGAPWLYAVARNAITDRGRARAEPPTEVPDSPSSEAGPADRAESSWTAWRVHRALEELNDNERKVIELAYWSGLSQSEIAEFLNIPLGTVKTRTRAALGAPRRAARGGARMSDRPNFDELAGGDDLSPEEAARLERVHDLLVAAGPPAELPPHLLEPQPGAAARQRLRPATPPHGAAARDRRRDRADGVPRRVRLRPAPCAVRRGWLGPDAQHGRRLDGLGRDPRRQGGLGRQLAAEVGREGPAGAAEGPVLRDVPQPRRRPAGGVVRDVPGLGLESTRFD